MRFLNYDGILFLAIPNFAFQVDIDWFSPFKHTQHSEGAIYLSVINLPHNERFLQQNIIPVGVILGPKEPSLLKNSFLTTSVIFTTALARSGTEPTQLSYTS